MAQECLVLNLGLWNGSGVFGTELVNTWQLKRYLMCALLFRTELGSVK